MRSVVEILPIGRSYVILACVLVPFCEAQFLGGIGPEKREKEMSRARDSPSPLHLRYHYQHRKQSIGAGQPEARAKMPDSSCFVHAAATSIT